MGREGRYRALAIAPQLAHHWKGGKVSHLDLVLSGLQALRRADELCHLAPDADLRGGLPHSIPDPSLKPGLSLGAADGNVIGFVHRTAFYMEE